MARCKLTTEAFVAKARARHGDRYDYTKTVVRDENRKPLRVPLTITCLAHGDFQQRADSHLQGNGCKKCQDDSRRMTTEDFIKKARKAHGDRFDYSQADYKGSHEMVTIVCPLHGPFEQKAYLHVQNRGCRECKYMNHPGGYSYELFMEDKKLADTPAIFYIVEYKFDNEEFIKIGITQHDAYTRHKSHWKNVTILTETMMTLKEAFHREQVTLHRPDLQPYRYYPRGIDAGNTECFTLEAKPFLF